MPAKGENYNRIPIDLKRYVDDWLGAHPGSRVADFAKLLYDENGRALSVRRGYDMAEGKINTVKYVEIVVNCCEGGNYAAMAKYATTPEGLAILKELQATKKLTPYKLDVYRQVKDAALALLETDEGDETLRQWAQAILPKKRRGRKPKRAL